MTRQRHVGRTEWLVAGAGFSGATLAERLATQLGARVLVVDRRPHLAGNAFDEIDSTGVRVHRYGAHIFHTKSEQVWRYLSHFSEWYPYVHRVLASLDGQLVPVPCNLTTLAHLLGLAQAAELERLSTRYFPDQRKITVLSLVNHHHPLLRAAGREVYEKIFLQYTLKQWGYRPEELDRSVTARVPVLISRDDRYFSDPYQGIPKDGYTALVERLLDNPLISVELGCDYRSLGNHLRDLPTIYTGPIDEFFGYVYGHLPYRSLRFQNYSYGVNRLLPVAVVNHPNAPGYTRVIEHAHFLDQHVGATTVTYEFPEPYEPSANEPYYPVPKQENHHRYQMYANLASSLAGRVFFVGRLAEYRYYDMDQAVAHALAVFNHQITPQSTRRSVGQPARHERRLATLAT